MKLELYQEVALLNDVPEASLRAGDVAMWVDAVPHPTGGETGAVLEVYNALGESIGVVTVPLSAIAPLRSDQVPAVRTLTQAAA